MRLDIAADACTSAWLWIPTAVLAAVNEIRQELQQFHEVHNQDGDGGSLLDEWRGYEQQLLVNVKEKYGIS
eukprot:COSAG02_NODE_4150_length_5709_cov_97.686631_2_plen_71_part_00